MSRRPRRLPLNDRRWLPLTAAYPWVYRLTGDYRLAARDLNAALADGRLRSMRRRGDGGVPDRELLSSSFWAEHEISGLKELLVMPRGNRPFELLSVFYVWEPDYEEIFGGGANPRTQVVPTTKKAPPEGTTKQGAPLKHDWVAITTEAAFREATATKKQRDKSILAAAGSMRAWCGKHLHKRPSITDLREIITTVRRRFRQPE